MNLQFEAQSQVIVVAGNSGSGKSTFVIRYLLNGKFSARFIFDPRGEYAVRFKRRAVALPSELTASLQTGYTIFDPHPKFPGDENRAFENFCEWSHHMAGKILGRKIFFVDEVWKHCSPNKIPLALARIVQDGRKNGITLITSTQRPNRINEAILNECNELVSFRLRGRNALNILTAYDEEFPVDELPQLTPLHFIARNLDTGGELRGVIKF